MAAPTPRTSRPVAIGSSVPAWPTLRTDSTRRARATTSCEVIPRGLVDQQQAGRHVGVGTAGTHAAHRLRRRQPAVARHPHEHATSRSTMNRHEPGPHPGQAPAERAGQQRQGQEPDHGRADGDGAQVADVTGAHQHAVQGEDHAGERLHGGQEPPDQLGLREHGGVVGEQRRQDVAQREQQHGDDDPGAQPPAGPPGGRSPGRRPAARRRAPGRPGSGRRWRRRPAPGRGRRTAAARSGARRAAPCPAGRPPRRRRGRTPAARRPAAAGRGR